MSQSSNKFFKAPDPFKTIPIQQNSARLTARLNYKHSQLPLFLYPSFPPKKNTKRLYISKPGNFEKIVMPRPVRPTYLMEYSFTFSFASGNSAYLRMPHYLCINRPGDLNL